MTIIEIIIFYWKMLAVLLIFGFLSIILMMSMLTKNRGYNRIVIINTVGNFFLASIMIFSYYSNQPDLIDFAILYALSTPVMAVGLLIYSRYKK